MCNDEGKAKEGREKGEGRGQERSGRRTHQGNYAQLVDKAAIVNVDLERGCRNLEMTTLDSQLMWLVD
jgi:hypothetical protein